MSDTPIPKPADHAPVPSSGGASSVEPDTAARAARLRAELTTRRTAGDLLAEATRVRDQSVAEADHLMADAQELSERLVTEARERAEGIVAQARAEASRITGLSVAEAEAARVELAAQREAARDEARAEALQEMALLRLRVEQLVGDIDAGLGSLGTMLEGARSTVVEVQRAGAELGEVGPDLVPPAGVASSRGLSERTTSDRPSSRAERAAVRRDVILGRDDSLLAQDPPNAGDQSAVTEPTTRPESQRDQLVAAAPEPVAAEAVGADGPVAEPAAASSSSHEASAGLSAQHASSSASSSSSSGPSAPAGRHDRPLGWLFRGD